jgi:hypothetical protein
MVHWRYGRPCADQDSTLIYQKLKNLLDIAGPILHTQRVSAAAFCGMESLSDFGPEQNRNSSWDDHSAEFEGYEHRCGDNTDY